MLAPYDSLVKHSLNIHFQRRNKRFEKVRSKVTHDSCDADEFLSLSVTLSSEHLSLRGLFMLPIPQAFLCQEAKNPPTNP